MLGPSDRGERFEQLHHVASDLPRVTSRQCVVREGHQSEHPGWAAYAHDLAVGVCHNDVCFAIDVLIDTARSADAFTPPAPALQCQTVSWRRK